MENEYITKQQAIDCVERTKESIQAVTQLTKDYHSVNIICTNVIGNITQLEVETVNNISESDEDDFPEFKCSGCGICVGEYVEHTYYADSEEFNKDEDYECDYVRHIYALKYCPECGRKIRYGNVDDT